jgi:hypothetical protein
MPRPREKTPSRCPPNLLAVNASTNQASVAPEKKVKPRPMSAETSAHQTNSECNCHSSTYSAVVTARVRVPQRKDARRPQWSATTPVGISKMTMPAVKQALAPKASKFVSPASSRKIVLIPQISEAAKVVPAVST